MPSSKTSSQPGAWTCVSRGSWATGGASFASAAAAAAAKSLQSCPTLCDPIDGSPPGSSTHGIFQARTLEWVAISFSNAWKGKVKVKSLSRVWLLVSPWTAAYQAPPPMGFSRQEYWSGLPLPLPSLSFASANQFNKLLLNIHNLHVWGPTPKTRIKYYPFRGIFIKSRIFCTNNSEMRLIDYICTFSMI